MALFRKMPHWQVLVFYYGFGFAVAWQFVEDMTIGHAQVHSGELAPWRQYVNYSAFLGTHHYRFFAAAEAILLLLYFFRVRVRFTALALGALMFADNLGSFLNHRLLMSLEMMLISFVPLPKPITKSRLSELHGYWNMDIIRFQVSLVYVITALHKCNSQFLSGQTLNNLFFMTHSQGMNHFSDWLFPYLQDARVCLVMAWIAVASEVVLAFGLYSPKRSRLLLPMAIGMHLSFSVLMPYIWIFTTQMLFTLFLFYRHQETSTADTTVNTSR